MHRGCDKRSLQPRSYCILYFWQVRLLVETPIPAQDPLATSRAKLKIETLIWVSFWRAPKFNPSVEELVEIQDVNPRTYKMNYKTHNKLVNELYGTCFQYNVKNWVNHLTLLLIVTMPYACWFLSRGRLYWGLQVMSTQCFICGCVLKGCFGRGILWRAKLRLKGIEDFNLEHCSRVPQFQSGWDLISIKPWSIVSWHMFLVWIAKVRRNEWLW